MRATAGHDTELPFWSYLEIRNPHITCGQKTVVTTTYLRAQNGMGVVPRQFLVAVDTQC